MAKYENLPIFRTCMRLTIQIETAVHGFARYHKYALGADLRQLSRALTSLVVKANSMRDKVMVLTELRDKSEELKCMLVLGKELKIFQSFGQFQQLSQLAVEVSRQSQGWLNSQQKKV